MNEETLTVDDVHSHAADILMEWLDGMYFAPGGKYRLVSDDGPLVFRESLEGREFEICLNVKEVQR